MNLCGFDVGQRHPIFLIAGNCVIESEKTTFETAEALVQMCRRVGVPLIYKSSFDKANRSSGSSYRGPGMEEGLRILDAVKREFSVPVITDVHEDTPIDEVASVVDVMQTPAFLSRQTNFINRVCAAGLPVNIKKGQF
ncbi:MAG: 3-deoxy-8-phosphooctulonate synthase, partial [Pseudomonadota bacterium]